MGFAWAKGLIAHISIGSAAKAPRGHYRAAYILGAGALFFANFLAIAWLPVSRFLRELLPDRDLV